MFPLPWNFPFRKKDGTITDLNSAISGGGGGGYTLPTASSSTKGGVKVGVGLTMDGETLKNDNPTPYSLPAAAANLLGGIKVGSGLQIAEDGTLSASGGSGGACHLFYCETNQMIAQKMYVLTSESSLTDWASLKQCLKNGIGLVVDGSAPATANSFVPYVEFYESGSTSGMRGRYIQYSLSDSTLSITRSTTNVSSNATVSNIKQIF